MGWIEINPWKKSKETESVAHHPRTWPVWHSLINHSGPRQNNSVNPQLARQLEPRWVAVRAENESRFMYIDRQGTIYLPDSGIAVETWFFQNDNLDIPSFERHAGQYPFDYYGVHTDIVYSGGMCSILLFPIAALTERFAAGTPPKDAGRFISAEYRIKGRQDTTLHEMMLFFIVRPFSGERSKGVRCLEYKENYLWVNRVPMIYFPVSPGCCFFTEGEGMELYEYLRHRQGKTRADSPNHNCTGLIGYSGLTDELDGTTYFINYSSHARRCIGGYNSFLRNGSELIWQERYKRPKNMIHAGRSPLDEILSGTFPHLLTFGAVSGGWLSPCRMMTLNRWGFYKESRALLQEAVQNALLLNVIKNKAMGYALPFLIHDYFRFSHDREFLSQYRSRLEVIGNWLLYTSGFGLKKERPETEVFQNEDAFWLCASLKAMASLAKFMNLTHESLKYQEHYFQIRTFLLRHIHDFILRNDAIKRLKPVGVQELMNLLTAIYPLNLLEKGSEAAKRLISRVFHDDYQEGAFGFPEFDGTNFRITATFGQVLLWEGLNYRPILDFLYETGKDAWNWPERMDPSHQTGTGDHGHDPETLFRVLLMVRTLFVLEEDEVLELFPGASGRGIWRCSRISLQKFPTHFGEIECDYRNVGLSTEINFNPHFWKRPSLIRIRRNDQLRITFCNSWVRENHNFWEFGPEFRRLRFKSMTSVDAFGNT